MIDIYGTDLSKPRPPRLSPLTEAERDQIEIIQREIDSHSAEIRRCRNAIQRITHFEPKQP